MGYPAAQVARVPGACRHDRSGCMAASLPERSRLVIGEGTGSGQRYWLLAGELRAVQLGVQAARCEQLRVLAALDDPAAVDDQDLRSEERRVGKECRRRW